MRADREEDAEPRPVTAARLNLPEVEQRELEGRLRAAQTHMQATNLDAMLITSEANFRYFSGLNTQSWASPTRPMFLILPAEGHPTAVVPTGSRVVMEIGSWIDDLRTWPAPRPTDDGVSLLIEALRERLGAGGRIGGEFGPEQQLRMPIIDFWRVQSALAPATFVDSTQITRRLRMVKSPAEIARIRAAAETLSAGFARLPGTLAPGQTERDVCLDLQLDLLRRGMDRITYMIAASGPGGYATINSSPSDRHCRQGDVLIIDAACPIDGYFCDFDRNFAFGPPEDAVRRANDTVYAATDAGIAAARPGATAADVWQAMARHLEGGEGADVGRMGHGIGLSMTEPPSIHPGDQTVLKAGMVLTVEPGIAFRAADGRRCVMVHEENLVVTEDAPLLLSRRAPAEMLVIQEAGRA